MFTGAHAVRTARCYSRSVVISYDFVAFRVTGGVMSYIAMTKLSQASSRDDETLFVESAGRMGVCDVLQVPVLYNQSVE